MSWGCPFVGLGRIEGALQVVLGMALAGAHHGRCEAQEFGDALGGQAPQDAQGDHVELGGRQLADHLEQGDGLAQLPGACFGVGEVGERDGVEGGLAEAGAAVDVGVRDMTVPRSTVQA